MVLDNIITHSSYMYDLLQESGFVPAEDEVTMPSVPCESLSADEEDKQVLSEIISFSSADSLFSKLLSVFGENGTLLPCYRATV